MIFYQEKNMRKIKLTNLRLFDIFEETKRYKSIYEELKLNTIEKIREALAQNQTILMKS